MKKIICKINCCEIIPLDNVRMRAQIIYWALGLGRERGMIRGRINGSESVKLRVP